MKKTLTYSYYLIGYGCIITALISIFKLIHKLDLHAPDPLTGLIFIGSTTNAIVLFNTKSNYSHMQACLTGLTNVSFLVIT